MNVIYDIAEVRVSEVHTQRVEVPRWEIPVLQVLHGDDVKVTGQTIVKRPIPDPREEFKRLADRYGPKNGEVPAVASVYGNFGPGTQKLREEIRDSLTEADATPKPYTSPAQRKAEAERMQTNEGSSIVEEAQAKVAAEKIAAATPLPTEAELVDNEDIPAVLKDVTGDGSADDIASLM